ncbi:carbohydrate kinase family protein [Gemmatimonadota bacterium]
MKSPKYRLLVGTGGIGSGIFFQLKGSRTLGRNESRPGYLLDAKDFCKLHIICHYVAVLLGSRADEKSAFRTVPVGRVGGDETGSRLLEMMNRAGMDTAYVGREKDTATLFSVCFQYPDTSGGNVTTADSASNRVSVEDIRRAESLFREYRGAGIALAVPEVPLETRLELLKTATRYDFFRVCALNSEEFSQEVSGELLQNADIVSMNRDEAETLVGERYKADDPQSFLSLVGKKCGSLNPGLKICLTLGAAGSYGYEKGAWEYTPCARVEPKSTAGAGDAAISGLIAGMVWGLPFILQARGQRKELSQAPLETSLDFAALLAAHSVESVDTINLQADRQTLKETAARLGISISEHLAAGLSAAV